MIKIRSRIHMKFRTSGLECAVLHSQDMELTGGFLQEES